MVPKTTVESRTEAPREDPALIDELERERRRPDVYAKLRHPRAALEAVAG
jgi:hypothetical protein